MSQITVKGFAEQIGVPPETLLRQLASAGVADKQPDDALSDEEKEQLFHFLRASHGASDEGAARRKITLKRKSTSQVIQSTRTGPSRAVQVEVRKKRTFVKRTEIEEAAPVEAAAPVPVPAEVIEAPAVPAPAAVEVAAAPAPAAVEAKKPAPVAAAKEPSKDKQRKAKLERIEERERQELHLADGKSPSARRGSSRNGTW